MRPGTIKSTIGVVLIAAILIVGLDGLFVRFIIKINKKIQLVKDDS